MLFLFTYSYTVRALWARLLWGYYYMYVNAFNHPYACLLQLYVLVLGIIFDRINFDPTITEFSTMQSKFQQLLRRLFLTNYKSSQLWELRDKPIRFSFNSVSISSFEKSALCLHTKFFAFSSISCNIEVVVHVLASTKFIL